MGETDPFVCLLCLPVRPPSGPVLAAACPASVVPGACAHPARPPGHTLGNVPVVRGRRAVTGGGGRAGVALSYLTPDGPWHTIWRTLANPGE
ncbi:hypothetical protein ACE1SV_04170 [Streptomyces sp. E-15]